MPTFKRSFAAVVLIVLLLAPSPTFAALISFGGRVTTVIPCSSGLHITIIPAGIFPVSYVWTPFTLTFSVGPPRSPGQQVLGLADTVIPCFVGKVPLFGFRMTVVGTSPVF